MTPPPLKLRCSPSRDVPAGPGAVDPFTLSPRLSQQLASRFSGSTISTAHLKTPRYEPQSQAYQDWSPVSPVSPSPPSRHRRTVSSGGNYASPRRQLMLGEREPIFEEEELAPKEQKDSSLVDGLKAAFQAPRWAHLEANGKNSRHSLPSLSSPTSPIIPMQSLKTSFRPLPPTRSIPAPPRSFPKPAGPISPTPLSPPLPDPPVSPDESFLSFPALTPGTTTPPRHVITPSPIRSSHLPPRSDSRAGFFTPPRHTPEISTPSSAASSSYRGIPNPRFSGSRRPRAIPVPSPALSLTVQAPFKAVILQSPSPAAAESHEERLVSLNVGGTIFVTLASTLIEGGGALGEFVQEVFEAVEVSLATIEGAGKVQKAGGLYSEMEEDRESFLDATHFDLSPFPSPFPFMRHDATSPSKSFAEDQDQSKWISLDYDPMNLPESPMDSRDFFTVLNSNQPHQVTSPHPHPPHLRVQSIHPSIVTYREDSGDDDEEDNLTLSSTPPPKSPACTTPRRPSPSRLESNPFEKSLASPFFSVLKGQQNRSPSSPSHPNLDTTTTSRPPSLSMSASSTEEGEIVMGKEISFEVSGRTLEIFLDRDPQLFVTILAFLQTHALPATHSLPPPTQPLPPLFPLVDPDFLELLVLNPTMIITLLASLRSLILEARWYGLKDLEAGCVEETRRIGAVVRHMVEEKRREERRVKVVASQSKAGWI